MSNDFFEGWYFKHQLGSDMLAFIPGRTASGAFVQMICTDFSRRFDVPSLTVENNVIRAGGCSFSGRGAEINLPDVSGRIDYGAFSTLGSDVMGPFRYLPMECRHGVISMSHALSGAVTICGRAHRFDGGKGYIEKDSGTSFPRSYMWLQCNDFLAPCSLMLSIADIPFGGFRFRGCICSVLYGNREYRLATYNGVKIHVAEAEHVRLSQGSLLLEIDAVPSREGHALLSPVRGKMSGSIRENCNTSVHVKLWSRGRAVFDLSSPHAAYEFVPYVGDSRQNEKIQRERIFFRAR